jgi:hypothetical protein
MTFWQGLKQSYGGSIAFLIACPLLALIPVIFELIQHFAEVRIGMYDSISGAKAAAHDPLRMGLGMVKIAAITLPVYWVPRFMATRDAKFTRALDPTAVRLFGAFLLFNVALAAFQLLVLPDSGAAAVAELVVGEIIAALIAAWVVAAALGDGRVGPIKSASIMWRQLPWTLALFIVGILPLMVPHYVLAGVAIRGPKSILWPALVVDSLLVGWIAALIAALTYVAAKRAGSIVEPDPALLSAG